MIIRCATATWTEANGAKRRWFRAKGKNYAIAVKDGDLALLDVKGKPVSTKKANKLLQALAS